MSPTKSSHHFNHARPMPARIFREVRNDDGHVVGIEPWMPIGAAYILGGRPVSNVTPFRLRQRAVNPNDIDHVKIWAGISKEWQAPVYGVDYVLGDGGHACMGWWPDLARAMAQARELAAWGPYPIREGEP